MDGTERNMYIQLNRLKKHIERSRCHRRLAEMDSEENKRDREREKLRLKEGEGMCEEYVVTMGYFSQPMAQLLQCWFCFTARQH